MRIPLHLVFVGKKTTLCGWLRRVLGRGQGTLTGPSNLKALLPALALPRE
jgi:hypothetical protein